MSPSRFGPVTVGFGTSVTMWGLGFFLRLPPAVTPSAVLVLLFVLLLAGGGAVAGRAGRGAASGAAAGAVTSLVNLLILGSLLSSDDPGRLVPSAAIWIPGSLALGAALGAIGGAIGRAALPAPAREPNWTGAFARVASLATLFLVMVGGLVTSREAGLAVVDWPNSYGYNMFLYPLSRMVGGIYYEHAHRLFGSLVGLTVLVLSVRLLASDRRGWLKVVGVVALLFVVGQGILGGLRVTGHFTLSDSPEVTRPSLLLAMVHGVGGQVFLALVTAIAAFTSRTWLGGRRHVEGNGGADHGLSAILVVSLLVQLVLGVRTRHTGEGVMIHVTMAMIVLIVAMAVGVRLLGGRERVPVLRKTGGALVGHTWTQVLLGALALVALGRRGDAPDPTTFEIVMATAHQTMGAILLANAVQVAIWSRRLLAAGELPAVAAEPEASGTATPA